MIINFFCQFLPMFEFLSVETYIVKDIYFTDKNPKVYIFRKYVF